MKVTINWTDHKYHTYDFTIVETLPEEGKREYFNSNEEFKQCDNVRDITGMVARSDWGDDGYYTLYEVRYVTGVVEDGKDIEDDDYSYEYVAVWNEFKEVTVEEE